MVIGTETALYHNEPKLRGRRVGESSPDSSSDAGSSKGHLVHRQWERLPVNRVVLLFLGHCRTTLPSEYSKKCLTGTIDCPAAVPSDRNNSVGGTLAGKCSGSRRRKV